MYLCARVDVATTGWSIVPIAEVTGSLSHHHYHHHHHLLLLFSTAKLTFAVGVGRGLDIGCQTEERGGWGERKENERARGIWVVIRRSPMPATCYWLWFGWIVCDLFVVVVVCFIFCLPYLLTDVWGCFLDKDKYQPSAQPAFSFPFAY